MLSGPWGHDRAWERSVVEAIRRGGAAPQAVSLYDSVPYAYYEATGDNSPSWEQAEAHSRNAIRSGAVYLNDEANARRAAQRKAFREGVREAQAEAKARADKVAADRRAYEAELRETRLRAQAAQAEREQRLREQAEAWDQETQRRAEARRRAQESFAREAQTWSEEARVLASKWACTACNSQFTVIRPEDEGYRIICVACDKSAWGSHGSLMRVLNQQPVDNSR